MPIENVFVFVADALREDHLPPEVEEWGEKLHTISASTNTPSSFSSIFSGLYPTQHQTFSFKHRLDPDFNFLQNIDDRYDVRFHEYLDSGVADILGVEYSESNPITDIEPPFVLLEREDNTHAPYDEFHEEGNVEDIDDYFDSNPDWEWIKQQYQSGCDRAAKRFFERISSLKSRGLLEDTLVIFTSDHGELLGEYGELSHGSPVVPELVQVPTVIKHPEAEPTSAKMMGHIDILPTISDCLDVSIPWNLPGESLFGHDSNKRIAEFVQSTHLDGFSLQNYYNYRIRSVWDANGGYVFNQTGSSGKIIHTIRQAKLFNPFRGRKIARSFNGLYHHLSSTRTFGNPEFSQSEAKNELERIDEMGLELSRSVKTLSEETEDRLKTLGYK